MAFKRTTSPTFTTEVKVPVANDKGGHDMNTFTARFSRSTSTEQEALRKLTNAELIQKKLVGWDLVDDETKEAVPFTPENLAALLEISPTPMQICVAFWETVNGARAKN